MPYTDDIEQRALARLAKDLMSDSAPMRESAAYDDHTAPLVFTGQARHRADAPPSSGRPWTAGEVWAVSGILIAAAFVVLAVTVVWGWW